MQVVITQHDNRVVTEIPDEFHYGEGFRSPVDEIAGEPKPIAIGIELYFVEQGDEFIEAALNIANRVGSHVAVNRT